MTLSNFADIKTTDDIVKMQIEDPARFQAWQVHKMRSEKTKAPSPVFQALVQARLQKLNRDEAAIAEDVNAALGPKPADTHRPAWFIRWCEDRSLPWRPANPAVIAKFVMGHTTPGKLVDELRELSLAHTSQGLPDPVAAWQVVDAIGRVVKVETPRSWKKEQRLLFAALAPDMQQHISDRESQRDKEVRRAQNEAADARKQLADIQKQTEATDGTIPENKTEAA